MRIRFLLIGLATVTGLAPLRPEAAAAPAAMAPTAALVHQARGLQTQDPAAPLPSAPPPAAAAPPPSPPEQPFRPSFYVLVVGSPLFIALARSLSQRGQICTPLASAPPGPAQRSIL